MIQPLKLVFFSSSDFCIPILEAILANSKYQLLAVVSTPSWINHGKTYYNPITKFAKDKSLPLFLTANINQDLEKFKIEFGDFDLGVVASFGQIIKQELLELPKYGLINWHPSNLPFYRGPTPIQTALANGDTTLGLCYILMDKGMDSGAVLVREQYSFSGQNFIQVATKMGQFGGDLLSLAIDNHLQNKFVIQDNTQATFTKMLTKDIALVDPKTIDSYVIYNHVLAYSLFPKTLIKTDKYGIVKILEANLVLDKKITSDCEDNNFYWFKGVCYLKTQDGVLQLTKIQLDNGRKLEFKKHGS
jgi:methionyl-tRNA formyltransferase